MTTREPLAGELRRRQYRFGEFVLDLDAGFLRRNENEVALRPKAFDVLTYLVLHHGQLISKNELVKAVWPEAAVTDNSLAQCLFEIRRAIDDESQTIIRTVARRGCVFEAPVSSVFGDPTRTAPGPVIARSTVVEDSPTRTDPSLRAARWLWRLAAGLVALSGAGMIALLVLRGDSSIRPVTETPVQLTDFNDSAIAPALSHDGRMLAFIRGGSFGKVGAPSGQVYVKLLDGGAPVQLTRDAMDKIHPVFSPDDSRIVYMTLLSGLRWDSWQVPVLGGTPQPFLPNASGLQWVDGRRLVYSTIRTGTYMGVATSTESRDEYREIYFPERKDGMAHRSAPSPDGKWLLIVEMSAGTWLPCRLVPLDGSSHGRRVGPPGAQCTTAAWSPDGRWMYVSSNAGGAFHVWRQRFPDGDPMQITFGPTEQEGTAITRDGRYLITSMGLQQATIWLHDGTNERKLTEEAFVSQPVVSPSGTQMFYVVRTSLSRGQTSGELWSVDLKSGERQRILPGIVVANYSLSHDGQKIVFTSGNEKGDGIWVADIHRRNSPRQLVRGSDLRAFYGAPGEIVYSGADSRLYRMKEDGSAIEKISPDPVAYLATVSPDGRWAVAILPQAPQDGVGTTSLWFVSLRGEESFEVCNQGCSVGPRSFLITAPFAWSSDAKWLFVNLVHFGMGTPRTIVLPYRSNASPQTLWPKGLRFEKDLAANPAATIIQTGNTIPAAGREVYLSSRTSTQSNLYRLRITD